MHCGQYESQRHCGSDAPCNALCVSRRVSPSHSLNLRLSQWTRHSVFRSVASAMKIPALLPYVPGDHRSPGPRGWCGVPGGGAGSRGAVRGPRGAVRGPRGRCGVPGGGAGVPANTAVKPSRVRIARPRPTALNRQSGVSAEVCRLDAHRASQDASLTLNDVLSGLKDLHCSKLLFQKLIISKRLLVKERQGKIK